MFSFRFGSQGDGAGQVSSPKGVAVNAASGNVYVADTGNDRVDEFASDGSFIRAWGFGVANGDDRFEICTTNCQAGLGTASAPGQFQGPLFVAIDNSSGPSAGDVYVGDSHLVTKFDPNGNLVSSWGSGGQLDGSTSSSGSFLGNQGLEGIAVDANGNLWAEDELVNFSEFGQNGGFINSFQVSGQRAGALATDSSGDLYVAVPASNVPAAPVYELSPTGTYLGNVTGDLSGSPTGLAVDPTANDAYVDDGGNLIRHYSSACAPSAAGCTADDTFGAGSFSGAAGLGVDSANDEVYAADAGGNDIAVFASAALPEALTGQATGAQQTSATLNGTVNPHATAVTGCHFDYVSDAAYNAAAADPYSAGATVACSSTPSGSSAAPVSAQISGLTQATRYHFRLVATNANGAFDGADHTFSTPAAPQIAAQGAVSVRDTTAELVGSVDPDSSDTTYHFEYGTSTSYGTSVPVPDADVGAGAAQVQIAQNLTGLSPSTTYHFRLVTSNAFGTATGSDQTLTTQAPSSSCPNAGLRSGYAANLPDCRAFELVTPPGSAIPDATPLINGRGNLNGLPFYQDNWGRRAAVTGNGLTYSSRDPGAESPGDEYLASRGDSGWSTEGVIPPQSLENGVDCSVSFGMQSWSPDLSARILDDGLGSNSNTGCGADSPPLVAGEPQGVDNLFRHDSSGYQLVDVTTQGVTPADARFDGASSDLSRVVFNESARLTPNAPAGNDLYEWSGGQVQLVSILPDGTPVTGDLAGAQYNVSGKAFETGGLINAVSADGTQVVFATGGNLYVREHADQPQSPVSGGHCTDATKACSVQVDASQAGGSGGGGQFMWATADGSQVYFIDAASAGLTADTSPGSGQNLYRYDVSTGHLSDLTAVSQAEVQGVSGLSGDGAYLYFVADGALAPGATAGAPNMYLSHGGALTFIATLSAAHDDPCDWTALCLTARMSSNGQYIAFNSERSLTGYDNAPADPSACDTMNLTPQPTGQPCIEIYRYSATAHALSCASCNPSGAPPTAPSVIRTPAYAIDVNAQSGPLYADHNVSDSGQVFFDSPDALVPGSDNGHWKVYEYENGQLALLSSGTSSSDDNFYDATPSGSDVFIWSEQPLLPQATSNAYAVFDARVDGGFPYSPPAPPCSGDACKGPLSPAPAPPTAATVTFTGPGNSQPGKTPPPPGKVRVLSETVHGSAFLLRIKVPTGGRIAATGTGIKGVYKSVPKAGTYQLKVMLTKSEQRTLARRHRLKLTVRVSFTPASGAPSAATVSFTVLSARRHREMRRATTRTRGGAR